ncbi:MAG: acyltransferase [Burkholderiales bacterium]|nr:acyltransferase [Burkholderiales bacterium]
MAADSHRYLALDGLRGFAVLLVFCVHAAGNLAAVKLGVDFERTGFSAMHTRGEQILFWLFRSHHGVFLFFVLSGFLISRMWLPPEAALRAASPPGGPSALGRPGGARVAPEPWTAYRRFAWRRTLRIYPAFLIAFVASLAFAWHSGTWTPPDWPRLVGNLAFVNGAPGSHVAAFNVPTWSLFYEMTFYLAFPLAVLMPLRPGIVAAAGVVLPIAAVALGADVLVLCYSLLFAGVALTAGGDAIRACVARVPAPVIVAAYLVVTTVAMLDAVPAAVGIVAFGAVALLVIAKSLAPGNTIAWLLTRRALRALGRVSYSFYLLHWMIVVLVARAVEGASFATAATAIFGGGFVLSAIAAALSWWIAERPYFVARTGGR